LSCSIWNKNSGACFGRAITEILRPLSNVAKSFVDEIAVHSGGWVIHMVDLKKFIETIKQSGLTLNLKKCKWTQSQVLFCCKIIGSGKMLADPNKIFVVEGMKPPKTQREVREYWDSLATFGIKFRITLRDRLATYRPNHETLSYAHTEGSVATKRA